MKYLLSLIYRMKDRIKRMSVISDCYAFCMRPVRTLSNLLTNYKYYLLFSEQPFIVIKEENVAYYNFYLDLETCKSFWFWRFIKVRNLNPKERFIIFYSVFGRVSNIKKIFGGGGKYVKLFFSGENMDLPPYKHYKRSVLDYMDLSFGFHYSDVNNFFRYPIWIHALFTPDMQYKDIKALIATINNPTHRLYTERNRFCTLIAGHNKVFHTTGVRQILYDGLSAIDRIDCPGKFLHNTDSLYKEFKNDKINFLREYKFNICPENSNTKGYVTEKIIDSFRGGCIPIYWGSAGYIEPDIINPKSYLYFDGHNLLSLQEEVKTLHTDRAYYEAFCRHPPFLPDAADIIYERFFLRLEATLKRIFM